MYTVRIFMKCTHVCAAQKAYQLLNPDEIVEPHPVMNIKVAAFTVSKKSSNTYLHADTGLCTSFYSVSFTEEVTQNINFHKPSFLL